MLAGPEPSNPVPRLSLLQWNSNLPRANPEVFFGRVEQLWWFEDAKSSTLSEKYGTHTKAIFWEKNTTPIDLKWNGLNWNWFKICLASSNHFLPRCFAEPEPRPPSNHHVLCHALWPSPCEGAGIYWNEMDRQHSGEPSVDGKSPLAMFLFSGANISKNIWKYIPSLKLKNSTCQPAGNNRLPTIHVQVLFAISFSFCWV